jgi:rRNA maturation protein Rpf1
VISFTTGRETNQHLNSLLKELTHVVPKSKIIRRGKSNREELAFKLYENGFTHAIGIYRQHGGPGRIDFFTVNANGMSSLSPSAILKSVKLGREYQNRTKCTARAVTHNVDLTEETLLFCHTLSSALELPEIEAQQTSS